jgi:glycosyltransferase involved in cell wall biosynthesis
VTPVPGTVTVVIPTRNGASFIGDTIRSVLSQRRRADDIVVVDDGSTDGTPEIVAAFDSVRLLPSTGRGSNPARATAIADSASEYLAFLDHDDIWFPHHLDTLMGLLDRNPQAVVAYSEKKTFQRALEPEPVRTVTPQLVDLWDTFPTNDVGGPSSVLMRRSALEGIGGWPTWDRVPSDLYIWFRLADLGPFVAWRACTTGWRLHESSMSFRRGRDDPLGYARDRLDLLGEALDAHLARRPEDADRLIDRLDQLRELVDLLAVICSGDVDGLGARLERAAGRGRSPEDLFPYFRAALLGAVDGDPMVRRNLWRSYAAWPRDHRHLRRRVADPVVATIVLEAVRRQPRHPSRWEVPLTRATRHAVRPLIRKLAGTAWRRIR